MKTKDSWWAILPAFCFDRKPHSAINSTMTRRRKLPVTVSDNVSNSKRIKGEADRTVSRRKKKKHNRIKPKQNIELNQVSDVVDRGVADHTSLDIKSIKPFINKDASNTKTNTASTKKMKTSRVTSVQKKQSKQNHFKGSLEQKTVNDVKTSLCTNKGKQSCVVIPRKPDEISSNWKQLQESLQIKPKTAVKLKNTDKEGPVMTGEKENRLKPDIWFDDVDEVLIEASKGKQKTTDIPADKWNSVVNPLVKSNSYTGLTKVLAMDCEMVGTGSEGKDSILARVSIVNQFGQCVYDKYVQPIDKVTDYRTRYSGIRPGDMEKGDSFKTVQKEVHDMLKGRILVGHAVHNDLKVLFLDHPRKAIRDTAKYKPFRKLVQGRQPSLKKLSDQILGVSVQEGEHNSIQDAQAAMRLYMMYRKRWEKEIKLRTKLQKYKMKLVAAKEKPSVKSNLSDSEILENDR